MDHYEVHELIGEGSFGRVFKGRHKVTGNIVALKLIPKVGHSAREISSLRQECKIQKELNHPNIVKMLDAFETQNEVIAVTEYVPGELHKLFDIYKGQTRGRRLPEAQVQKIAVDLVSAMFYLHSNRILHRDIKPQNILIDASGRAKLCDFGFARNLGLNTFVLTSIKGTPLYMAPELIEEKPYDHAADLWSVGCILYELLVGTPPFSTNSLFQLIKKVRYESIQWPEDVSNECRDFLQGLLEKNCKQRLSWPNLLYHPFVNGKVVVLQNSSPELLQNNPLTQPLTESQELSKEIQRQDKAKLLPGGSQTLIKVAQRHEENKKKLEEMRKAQSVAVVAGSPYHQNNANAGQYNQHRRYSDIGQHQELSNQEKVKIYHDRLRRASDVAHPFNPVPDVTQLRWHHGMSYFQHLAPQSPIIPRSEPYNYATGVQHAAGFHHSERQFSSDVQFQSNFNSEAQRLTPELQDDDVVDFVELPPDGATNTTKTDESSSPNKNDYSEGILYQRNSVEPGDEEKPIENEEWRGFLNGQIPEIMKDPLMLTNRNFVAMIIAPLRKNKISPENVAKIIDICSVPFISKFPDNNGLLEILNCFLEVKVLANTVLILDNMNSKSDLERRYSLTVEFVSERFDQLVKFIMHLCHVKDDFVIQFCDSVAALKASKFFGEILQIDSDIASDTLSILTRCLYVMPESAYMVIDILDQAAILKNFFYKINLHIVEKTLYLIGFLANADPEYLKYNFDVTMLTDVRLCLPELANAKQFASTWIKNNEVFQNNV